MGRKRLADTHAHLAGAEFESDLEEVLERAGEAGVERILAVGSDLETSRRAIATAAKFDHVFAAVGLHPRFAGYFTAQSEELRSLMESPKVVAVGEIGLDFIRSPEDHKTQIEAFEQQVCWAEELALPVSVHNRGADNEILKVVHGRNATIILHCFSGSEDFARRAVDINCYVSFAGNLTFPNARALREAAAVIPSDRLLVESDAPVLAPQPWRGRRNEPAYIVATVETLAAVRGADPDELGSRLSSNAARLFGWTEG